MKNPFHRVPSYLDEKKKVTPEKYFEEIKEYFSRRVENQLGHINDVIEQANEFKQEAKLDESTKQKHIKNLERVLPKNPTELDVFNAKNDLAIKLNNQFFNSDKTQKLEENIKWMTDDKKGIPLLNEIMKIYGRASIYVEDKYLEGKIGDSYRSHVGELRKMISDNLNAIDESTLLENTLSESRKNLKESYYDILDRTTFPITQKSVEDHDISLSRISIRGTKHPVFENATKVKNGLTIGRKIEQEYKQYEREKENREIETNKNGEKKELRFNDVVNVRKISKKVDSDLYYPIKGRNTSNSDKETQKHIKKYTSARNSLAGYKEVKYDPKYEEDLDNEYVKNIAANSANIDKHEDGTMKLSDKVVKKDFFNKSPRDMNVTVHLNEDYSYDEPELKTQKPSTDMLSVNFDEFMNNPSIGNDNDRLLLANMNKIGEPITYNKIDKVTGKKERVTESSINLMTHEKHEKIIDIKQKAREDEYNGRKRKIKF